jgi:hypothetical protein
VNVRSLQFTRIVLRMSEWRHRNWIQYGGNYVTHFNAPRQSDTISMLPASIGWILLTLEQDQMDSHKSKEFPTICICNDQSFGERPDHSTLAFAAFEDKRH